MSYFDGFVLAVPRDRKADYKALAQKVWPMFEEYGALSMYETWGDDVPDGRITSFPMAVKKASDEAVVFSWIEWPDKQTRDRGHRAMETDDRMAEMADMPFDGTRMIWGGFEPLLVCRA